MNDKLQTALANLANALTDLIKSTAEILADVVKEYRKEK